MLPKLWLTCDHRTVRTVRCSYATARRDQAEGERHHETPPDNNHSTSHFLEKFDFSEHHLNNLSQLGHVKLQNVFFNGGLA